MLGGDAYWTCNYVVGTLADVSDLQFEWDPRKNAANRRKHGVSFEEAQTVFYDEHALLIEDPDEKDEDRFVLLGLGAEGQQGREARLRERTKTMRKKYDFSKAKKNPYAKRLKKQLTIRLDEDTLGYFRELSEELGIPYQTLINLYLRECAMKRKKPSMNWKATG